MVKVEVDKLEHRLRERLSNGSTVSRSSDSLFGATPSLAALLSTADSFPAGTLADRRLQVLAPNNGDRTGIDSASSCEAAVKRGQVGASHIEIRSIMAPDLLTAVIKLILNPGWNLA